MQAGIFLCAVTGAVSVYVVVEQYCVELSMSDGESSTTESETKADVVGNLMEQVCERRNLKIAYDRVMKNKGVAGVDGMVVAELKSHLKRQWPLPWAGVDAGNGDPTPESFMNRRIRNRMLRGGVGGRQGDSASCPMTE